MAQWMAAVLLLALTCGAADAMSSRHHRSRGPQIRAQVAARKKGKSVASRPRSQAVPTSGASFNSLYCCGAPDSTSLCRASGTDGDVERTSDATGHEGICPDTSVKTSEPAKRTVHMPAGDAVCAAPQAEAAVTECGSPTDEEGVPTEQPTLTRSYAFRK